MPIKKFTDQREASRLLGSLGERFTVIRNPDYVHPAYEIVPLAPPPSLPLNEVRAIVMDMDGTTTTTETLCIHALEFMVRKITNRMDERSWPGLNRERDYPNIIGNSTTRHVEYLIETYRSHIDEYALKKAFAEAAVWFLQKGRDPKRIQEVRINLQHFGGEALRDVEQRRQIITDANGSGPRSERMLENIAKALIITDFNAIVRAAVDIYYQRYHQILAQIADGQSVRLSESLFNDPGHNLIEPMPGIGVMLALVRGWLQDEALPVVESEWTDRKSLRLDEQVRQRLQRLGKAFAERPAKIAIVTSSIAYEAHIVLQEVFRVLAERIQRWPVSPERKAFLKQQFSDYQSLYDGIITASDSSEIRLKPHRDLYSLALHQMGIDKNEFDKVIGFEDSESGAIAIRAAGIGLCVAVPFSETQAHDFEAATIVCENGLPEVLIRHGLFLEPRIG